PFGSHLAMDTLPSGVLQVVASGPPWLVSGFRFRARLCFVIPSTFSGPRGITPAFGYGAPHSGARGTLTLLSNVLLSTHVRQADFSDFIRPQQSAPYEIMKQWTLRSSARSLSVRATPYKTINRVSASVLEAAQRRAIPSGYRLPSGRSGSMER